MVTVGAHCISLAELHGNGLTNVAALSIATPGSLALLSLEGKITFLVKLDQHLLVITGGVGSRGIISHKILYSINFKSFELSSFFR